MTWSVLALVTITGSLGAVLRFLVASRLDKPQGWPWGTFSVNLLGSLALGVCLGADLSNGTRTAVAGFLAGLTTYSGLVLQALDEDRLGRVLYFALTVLGGVVAAWLGYRLGVRL